MSDLSYTEFCLFDSIAGKKTTEILVCCECGGDFHKRENTKIDNLFCSDYCQTEHDIRRYYKIPVEKVHISNAGVIARTLNDYYGGYSE